MNKFIYFFLKTAAFFVFNMLYRVKAVGRKNVPLSGRLILVSNHASFFDPMVIFHTCPRRFHAVVGKTIYNIWWLKRVFIALACVPTNGSSSGAISMLNKEKAIVIFPEGRCELDGRILPLAKIHKGVAVFALKTAAPVIPIYVKGTFETWPVGKIFPKFFRTLEVRYGQPLYFGKMDMEELPTHTLESLTFRIMDEVKKLGN